MCIGNLLLYQSLTINEFLIWQEPMLERAKEKQMLKKVILIVLCLLVVTAIAYSQGGFQAPGDPFGGDPMMGPQGGNQMGQPRMNPMMPQMMPQMAPIMIASDNNLYILRGEQVIKLDGNLKVVAQTMLPRPQMPKPRAPQE